METDFLPRPACGERVGVRDNFRPAQMESPPHPEAAQARLPTSPRGRGEVVYRMS